MSRAQAIGPGGSVGPVRGPAAQVVIDCDPGLDDALALAALAHLQRVGRVIVRGVVAVAGNVGLGDTSANARHLVEQFQLAVGVVDGACEALDGRLRGDAVGVHGSDGLGGLRPTPARRPEALDLAAMHRLVMSMSGTDAERVLVAVGPLTNLALLVRHDPHLSRHLDRVVVMGGAFGSPRGNVTDEAEFNAWADPAAWQEVAAGDLPLEVVPLDVTTRVVLRRDDLSAVGPRSPVGRILAAGIELHERLGRAAHFEMHDPSAVAAVVAPELFGWHTGEVEVQTAGPAAGRTDLRAGSRHRVALEVDAERARDLLLEALADTTEREVER